MVLFLRDIGAILLDIGAVFAVCICLCVFSIRQYITLILLDCNSCLLGRGCILIIHAVNSPTIDDPPQGILDLLHS